MQFDLIWWTISYVLRVPLQQLADKGWEATFWRVWEPLYLALSAQVQRNGNVEQRCGAGAGGAEITWDLEPEPKWSY